MKKELLSVRVLPGTYGVKSSVVAPKKVKRGGVDVMTRENMTAEKISYRRGEEMTYPSKGV